MLLLTDLTDRELDPLELPPGGPNVKLRLKESGSVLMDWLDAALPLPAGTVSRPLAAPRTEGWGALVVVDGAAGSQYDALLAATRRERPPQPVAAVALTGRGFHGNRGRPWQAVRGNLHLSCALPLAGGVAAADARGLPALAAVAVCDALAACAPALRPRIKWINDVLLGAAKVAGVLAAVHSQGTRLTAAVLGIGINVAVSPPVSPTVFVPRVTCLQEQVHGRGVSLGQVLKCLLEALAARVVELENRGAGPLVAAYRAHCDTVGRSVAVWPEGVPDASRRGDLPPPVAAGEALRLDDDLALHVAGAPHPLYGGRLAYRDPSSAPGAGPPGAGTPG